MVPNILWYFSKALNFLHKANLPSICFQKEDPKVELQPAVCVENKTKPVVPNKIGELGVSFLGSSFQEVRAHGASCGRLAPTGPKSFISARGLRTFPSLVEFPSPAQVCQVHLETGGFLSYSNNPSAGARPSAGRAAFREA